MTKKEKLKKFWEEHGDVILITGGILLTCGGLVGANMWFKNYKKKITHNMIDLTGKQAVTWEFPTKQTHSFEDVMKCLNENKETDTMFAIFREGKDPSEYAIINLSKPTVVID